MAKMSSLPQFYVEALVDAFSALRPASSSLGVSWDTMREMLPSGIQDIITFLVSRSWFSAAMFEPRHKRQQVRRCRGCRCLWSPLIADGNVHVLCRCYTSTTAAL